MQNKHKHKWDKYIATTMTTSDGEVRRCDKTFMLCSVCGAMSTVYDGAIIQQEGVNDDHSAST